ncbi:hypothetical protein [Streptomyces sp. NPDC005784]|uniref:hypothetical protein n=1 Tax=Streptomyces sp. NPDC005784 TaxID=3364731 RepID=UPI00368D8979
MTGAAIVPDGWAVIENHPGLQFLAPGTLFEPDPEAVPLGPADAPQILELIDLARAPARSWRARSPSAAMSASGGKCG